MHRVLRKTLKKGRFENVPLARSKTMRAIKGKNNTTTEKAFRMALIRAGMKGWTIGCRLPGKPDVFFPKYQLAVFLDGCFWHGCKRCGHIPKVNSLFWRTKIYINQKRDRRNTRKLRSKGCHVMRIWEHSISQKTALEKILLRIQNKFAQKKAHASQKN